ncbi:MAG TPA: Wzz/FepE/Etk N-terminal domain-containing protein [Terriglobales bacterium]|nr:Wzz/FepE/Etk N-terminal domain-containing protein [Terriglobales bacterium]
MSENRELTMDDYLAMLRRRLKVIVIPALLAPIAGFGISYLFSPKYTSQSTVLVEGQKVPANYVLPVITSDFTQRVQTLSQEVVSPTRLKPVIQSLALVKPEEEGKLISDIQQNMRVEPVITSMSAAAGGAGVSGAQKKKPQVTDEPVPGFTVNYTDSNPVRAQKICNALTELIVDENLRSRSEVAQDTSEFLGRQLEDAKRALDDQDTKLAAFKKQYLGQLPTDVDNNMRMLMSLNSQLDASTQTLSRAQQDRAYTESMLAQQLAVWKSSQSSTNPQTLEQGLAQLQSQLLQQQARYTDDHPDVIKTKADIAEIEKKLKEINAAAASASTEGNGNDKASASEPPEIRQLRLQIHQYQNVIEQATLDQKKLQSEIGVYQSRTTMSPGVEEQYKLLTRDNDNALAFYKDLLAKKSSAGLGSSMETAQEGEQLNILVPAGLPESPSFPNRPILAAGGLGAGLALGALIAIILEFSDKSIRTEKDAAAIMDLPLLISLPWLGEEDEVAANANGGGRRRFWGRRSPPSPEEHEHVEV